MNYGIVCKDYIRRAKKNVRVRMAKAKASSSRVGRDVGSGRFLVAKPAVQSEKFTIREIREAVRSVVKGTTGKPKK